MKKKLSLLLAGALTAVSLAGCGPTPPAAAPAGSAAPAGGDAAAPAAPTGGDTAAPAAPAANAELNLIIASNQTSLDNPYSFGMDKFKEVVEDVSGGKISVTVHKGTLGENENELIEKLEM